MNNPLIAMNMRKALAQNPNLLRTLLGLSLTLILLLAYAVYGATIDTQYWIYETEKEITDTEGQDPNRIHVESTNQTIWIWTFDLPAGNLTWINASMDDLAIDGEASISSQAGLWSHGKLGVADAMEFNCADDCRKNVTHYWIVDGGSTISITTLAHPEPGKRDGGTVYADSKSEAIEKSNAIISSEYKPRQVEIRAVEPGDRDVAPSVMLSVTTEEFSDIEVFSVDAATEFLWALAAVIGCFAMVLLPSFTLYIAAQMKAKKDEEKLRKSELKFEIQESE